MGKTTKLEGSRRAGRIVSAATATVFRGFPPAAAVAAVVAAADLAEPAAAAAGGPPGWLNALGLRILSAIKTSNRTNHSTARRCSDHHLAPHVVATTR